MKELKAITVLLAVIVLFVLGVVLYQLTSVLLPFVIAVLLSFIFKPIVLWLVRRRVPMGLALVAVIVLVAGVIFLLSLVIVPSVNAFVQQMPKYQARLTALAQSITVSVQQMATERGFDLSTFDPASAIQLSTITSVATAGLAGVVTSLSNAFLVLLFLLFLLGGSGVLKLKLDHAFSSSSSERLGTIVENIDRQVRQYLVTKTLINLGVGLVTWIILLALGVDFAIFWGLLAFLMNYIPNVGSLIATVFPILTALVQFPTPTRAIIALVLLVIAQNVIGNVIEPKVMQFSLNLSPVLILVMLIFWGWLWGIWGMILSVPITSTVKIICENVDSLKPIAVLMSGRIEGVKAT